MERSNDAIERMKRLERSLEWRFGLARLGASRRKVRFSIGTWLGRFCCKHRWDLIRFTSVNGPIEEITCGHCGKSNKELTKAWCRR